MQGESQLQTTLISVFPRKPYSEFAAKTITAVSLAQIDLNISAYVSMYPSMYLSIAIYLSFY